MTNQNYTGSADAEPEIAGRWIRMMPPLGVALPETVKPDYV